MDAVVGKEFKDELPAVITRTLIAAGTKAGLAYAANRATQSRDNGWINILTRVATTVYQYATNHADLRTWRTLPKMIVVCRFPTPEDGAVTLTSPGHGHRQPLRPSQRRQRDLGPRALRFQSLCLPQLRPWG
jgi:hypothetical protein